jgi:hypothetical protein
MRIRLILSLCGWLLVGGAAVPQARTVHTKQVNPPDANPQYFPKGVFHANAEASDWLARWYAKYLRAMEEPSLFESAGEKAEVTYRLLIVSSHRRPIVIQLDVRPNGTGLVTAKMATGIHGKLGPVLRNESILVAPGVVEQFLDLEEKANFWTLPTENEIRRPNGSEWVMEGRRAGAYHVVDRWSPEKEDKYFKVCGYLIAMSPVKPEAVYQLKNVGPKRGEPFEEVK